MMPTDPARWPRPGQPAWDDTDYARDYAWLGQPRAEQPPERVTVREWFRKDRAAMWRRETHPAHGCAREIDQLAAAILTMNNPRLGEEYEVTVVGRDGTRERPVVLCLPADMIRIWAEQDCEAVLQRLLELAWPSADREKYDPFYNLFLRSSTTGQRFGGLTE